jgi:hypothetical protein
METYFPVIKTILSDWFQLTLNNPLYAAALATVVWLLTAIVYSIKVAFLKKKNIASEKARIEMQNSLNTAQQQMQLIQEELSANIGQMQKDKQLAQQEAERAAGLEEQLSQRNKQIAGIIQTLATSFDLGERPLPVTEDIKAEGLWQQHDRVITLLTARLHSEQQVKTELQQSYQAETLKRAEKEALIDALQTSLVTQTSQIAKLEQALAEQKTMLQQQLDSAKLSLSDALEKHQSDLAHLDELKQQTFELVHTRQQLRQLEEKLNVGDALIAQLEKSKPADQIKAQLQPALIKQDVNETIIELQKTDEEAPPVPSDIEQQPVSPVKEKTGGVAGKLKNLFGKTRQEPITAEPGSIVIKHDEPELQPTSLEVEQPAVSPAKGQFGKLKNLFGLKQQPEETKQEEQEIQPAPVEVEQPPVSPVKVRYGKTKYYFGDIKQQPEDTKQDEAETQPVPLDLEQPPVGAAKAQFGKLKNLFGSKQKPKDTKQDEEETQPAPSNGEQPSVSPAKGNLGKIKNLFGKAK